jgi:hypothetical protein
MRNRWATVIVPWASCAARLVKGLGASGAHLNVATSHGGTLEVSCRDRTRQVEPLIDGFPHPEPVVRQAMNMVPNSGNGWSRARSS